MQMAGEDSRAGTEEGGPMGQSAIRDRGASRLPRALAAAAHRSGPTGLRRPRVRRVFQLAFVATLTSVILTAAGPAVVGAALARTEPLHQVRPYPVGDQAPNEPVTTPPTSTPSSASKTMPTSSATPAPPGGPSLRQLADADGLKLGVVTSDTYDSELTQIEGAQFNRLELDWDFRWDKIEPQQGDINFYNPSAYVDTRGVINIGKAHDQQVGAQSLFWWGDYSDWIKNWSGTTDQLQSEVIEVDEFLTPYKTDFSSVVVLNEYLPNDWNTGIDDPFQRIIGPTYYVPAFQTQRVLGPSVRLLYNYSGYPSVSDPNYQVAQQVLQNVQNAGVTNLGVGLEIHIDASNPPTDQQLQQLFTSFNVPVSITEMDVNISSLSGDEAGKEQAQASIYKQVITDAIKYGVKSITFYQEVDKYSWLDRDPSCPCYHKGANPTLFDSDYEHRTGILRGAGSP